MQPEAAVLVVGPSWLGDMVMAQCLLQSLRQRNPAVPIDVLAPPPLLPLLARMPQVRRGLPSPFGHRVLKLHHRVAYGRTLRGLYSSAYVLPGSWKSAVVPAAAAIPHRRGYRREWRWGLLNDVAAMPEALRRRTAIAFQALADPEILADVRRLHTPRLEVDDANLRLLRNVLGLARKRYAVLAPGAEFGPAKRWPVRHWRTLVRELAGRGVTALLLGTAADQTTTEAIGENQPNAIDLAGKTSLHDAIDLVSGASVAVSNDSGLMHVAAAVGVALVAIYGSTSPANTPPLSPRARIARLGLSCSPCHARNCPLGHLACLEDLAPRLIVAEIEALNCL